MSPTDPESAEELVDQDDVASVAEEQDGAPRPETAVGAPPLRRDSIGDVHAPTDRDDDPAGSQAGADMEVSSDAEPAHDADGTEPSRRPDGELPRGAREDGNTSLIIGGRERQVRAVDFSQPTKFALELRRRIIRTLGPFCEAFASRLSNELHTSVELVVSDSNELTWSAAKAQLPPDVVAVALDTHADEPSNGTPAASGADGHMLLYVEPPLILQWLECLLGGGAVHATSSRKLSEIDWALTRRVLDAMTAQLGTAWQELGGLKVQLGEIDVEGDGGVSAPLSEPTFAITLESYIDGCTAGMSLLVPWSTIAPVADHILGVALIEDVDPREQRAMSRGLAGARVELRAELGAAPMPVEKMLTLAPGTLLTLQESACDGVQLFAEHVPLGRASPGLHGTHRAVKLTTPIEPTSVRAAARGGRPAATVRGGTRRRDVLTAHRAVVNGAGATTSRDGAAVGRASNGGIARMTGVPVRVSAELGRTTLPLGSALELPQGAVLELEQDADAPIELFAGGECFAHGTLQVTPEGQWAVLVDGLI